MRTLINWSVGAACATVIVTGFSSFPAPAQDVKNDRQELRRDTRDIRGDRREIVKDTQEIQQDRKDLATSRQQLRDAYKSGDPAAIKAARENFQKNRGELRGDLKERRQEVHELRRDRHERREDVRELREDKADRRADAREQRHIGVRRAK